MAYEIRCGDLMPDVSLGSAFCVLADDHEGPHTDGYNEWEYVLPLPTFEEEYDLSSDEKDAVISDWVDLKTKEREPWN